MSRELSHRRRSSGVFSTDRYPQTLSTNSKLGVGTMPNSTACLPLVHFTHASLTYGVSRWLVVKSPGLFISSRRRIEKDSLNFWSYVR